MGCIVSAPTPRTPRDPTRLWRVYNPERIRSIRVPDRCRQTYVEDGTTLVRVTWSDGYENAWEALFIAACEIVIYKECDSLTLKDLNRRFDLTQPDLALVGERAAPLFRDCGMWAIVGAGRPHPCQRRTCEVFNWLNEARITTTERFAEFLQLPVANPNRLLRFAVVRNRLEWVKLIYRHKLFNMPSERQVETMYDAATNTLPSVEVFEFIVARARPTTIPSALVNLTYRSNDPGLVRVVHNCIGAPRLTAGKTISQFSPAAARVLKDRIDLAQVTSIQRMNPETFWELPFPPKKRLALLKDYATWKLADPKMFAQLPREVPEETRLELLRTAQATGNMPVCTTLAAGISLLGEDRAGTSSYTPDTCLFCNDAPPSHRYPCGCTAVCQACRAKMLQSGRDACPVCRP